MIEKMKIVSIIGNLSDLDRVSRLIVINGSIHVINAFSELGSNNLNLSASRENTQILQELENIKPFASEKDILKDEAMINFFREQFSLEPEINKTYLSIEDDYERTISELREVYENIRSISEEQRSRAKNIEKLQSYLSNVEYLKNTNLRMEELSGLNFMSFRMIMLSNENYIRLKRNIENILSAVFKLAVVGGNTIIAVLTPNSLVNEAEKIFTSLNYTGLDLPWDLKGTSEEVIKQIAYKIEEEKRQAGELKGYVIELNEKYRDTVARAITLLELEKKAGEVRNDTALGNRMFFTFGFIPESKMENVRKEFKQNLDDNVLLLEDDAKGNRNGNQPPTRMKNNFIFRPFEMLINMYGTPSYGEKDPTFFFAVSYMLLFGAMFGDLGQGLIIFFSGLFLAYRKGQKGFGGILTRLGISSMIFGVLYGSIFGSEEIIEPLLIRPMENINTMLSAAIVLGSLLTTVSYVYSLINHIISGNVEEGLFGREGLAGFLFFLTLIFAAAGIATGRLTTEGIGLPIGIMALLLLVIVFKQPLTGIIMKHRLYEGSPGDYYVEAGFGIIETVISAASNIISFIRVGAFALNHAGLYIAFATLAGMVRSGAGSGAVLVIGNIFIIGLEGLIVFIQSLRLEYYELFSKYYSGYGIEYKPIGLFKIGDRMAE